MELRDKVKSGFTSQPIKPNISSLEPSVEGEEEATKFQDAIAALTALGYKLNEADKAVNRAINKLGPSVSVEEIIKTALNP